MPSLLTDKVSVFKVSASYLQNTEMFPVSQLCPTIMNVSFRPLTLTLFVNFILLTSTVPAEGQQ